MPVGEGWGDGIVRELGMDMYTLLLYLKWLTNKDCSCYSTEALTKCYVAVCGRREFGGETDA